VAGEGGAVACLHQKLLFCSRGGTGRFSQNNLGNEGGAREGLCAKMTVTFG
jgi:hypothetical protein